MISRRRFLKLASGGIVTAAALGSYAFGFEPLVRLQTTHYQPEIANWPRGMKLRIAALADLHACKPWMDIDRIRQIVERTNALKPDLIVLLGDYTTGMNIATEPLHSTEWGPELGKLSAPLGVHAVLGNHDWWEDRVAQRLGKGPTFVHRALENAGINVLENDAVRLKHGAKSFWLAGLGDQLAFPPYRRFNRKRWKTMDDLDGTLAKLSGDDPAILLAHEPDIFSRVPDRFGLTLSGHTHGGQVRLMGYSPVTTSGQRLNYGHVREGDRNLIVSGGLGCSMLPIRFGSPPEIVLVEPVGCVTPG